MFEGRSLGINTTLAMFITMNPMYEFRNVLPSNLKVGRSTDNMPNRGEGAEVNTD